MSELSVGSDTNKLNQLIKILFKYFLTYFFFHKIYL